MVNNFSWGWEVSYDIQNVKFQPDIFLQNKIV